MKILIISFYYPPDLSAGSFRIGSLVESLIASLPENGQVEVITTLPNRYRSFDSKAKQFENYDSLRVHRIPLPEHESGMFDQAKAFIVFMRQALKLVKSKEYQLVFGTSSRLMSATLSAIIASRKRIPLYLDIRDIFVDTIKDVLPKKVSVFASPIFKIVEKWTINKAEHVNLVSEGFRDYFISDYPNKTYSYFTNGIDEEFMNFRSSSKSIESVKSDRMILMYAGNIGEGQGLHKIIPEVADILGELVFFWIIGDGGRKKALETALSEKKIKNVMLIPPVNREQLLIKYREADVLFLHLNDYPAFKKVLPSKIFEYAAVGKPILAGLPGYSAKFLENEVSNSAVFKPCDAKDAVRAIENLEIKSNTRIEFVNKFSRKRIMQKMADSIISTCLKYKN